ncbi:DUF2959 domain-containing protein [Nitrosococcus oceani]|uniref:ATPase involved in DNA repair n=2 Tax=Nitrosococcus oceani TaxID=1229 RepID=Q3JB95_NITOC|nr:DUF2959 domain-containing protein [Nitrosococcus oceani]KFI19629.1 DNA repair protein [Nitrosococcus oceani C-27]ABA57901.1 conserved hypothetical protein [Nitrosococcus oceani ATCC 19707]EDZ68062.1 hypothetical protein NOC27_1389 [Nitrosococcus oceani AFC27]KFI22846.1 DNA repair protein [Nitrosococcus oceani]GEM19544.1 DNA repair ATPase [Nitrosococcus oceani]
MLNITLRAFLTSLFLLLLTGCQAAYYKTMEEFGYHKRDILADRVEEVRDTQIEAKEQFQSALEQFSSVVNYDGGDLEDLYEELNGEYQASQKKAEAVHDRIASVENVAGALFQEWEEELDQYDNPSLRRSSQQQLTQTRTRYDKLIRAMKRAEAKIEPVLTTFHDQVLFLKHNLNARAIASLQGELSTIETDVNRLVQEMEAAIDEANEFIKTLES